MNGTSQRLWFASLALAGLLDCSLALYHSILPYHMNWQRGLVGVPDSLAWALFALNFSWSVIVFLTGCLVFYVARLTLPVDKFVKLTGRRQRTVAPNLAFERTPVGVVSTRRRFYGAAQRCR